MIKRQFYVIEHRDQDDDSSSSDDDSQPANEPSTENEEGGEGTPAAAESPESGYQREDSSDSDKDLHNAEAWPHQLTSDDDGCPERDGYGLKQNKNNDLGGGANGTLVNVSQSKLANQWAEAVDETERDRTLDELDDCVIKYKSVFKCRLCPRIVCLSEQTMRVHLDSKRHARSQKLYAEGRLKLMLNSDGEVEEEMETHAERHARIMASVQQGNKSKKRNRGRQRQKQRAKKKKSSVMANVKTEGKQSSQICEKKNNARRDIHHGDS